MDDSAIQQQQALLGPCVELFCRYVVCCRVQISNLVKFRLLQRHWPDRMALLRRWQLLRQKLRNESPAVDVALYFNVAIKAAVQKCDADHAAMLSLQAAAPAPSNDSSQHDHDVGLKVSGLLGLFP